jgi:hypothetical protein
MLHKTPEEATKGSNGLKATATIIVLSDEALANLPELRLALIHRLRAY